MTSPSLSTPPSAGVLACTDFSPAADQALQRAAWLAAHNNVPLTALHVVSGGAVDVLRQWLSLSEPVEKQLLQAAHTQLGAQVKRCLGEAGVAPHSVGLRVSAGQVLAEIQAVLDVLNPECLVLGPRGESDFARLVLGTTAERLLRRAQRPLLVVRNPTHGPYRRVLVPIDFSRWTAATLQAVRRVAPGAHCVLMHAWTLPFEDKLAFAGVDADTVAHYRQQAQSQAEQCLHQAACDHDLRPGDWTPCLVQGDASHAILTHARRENCDLIALGKHGRHAAEELLLGSVCRHVLSETHTDVLVAT